MTTDATPPRADWAKVGPLLWAQLHTWALRADLSAARQWLDSFEVKFACGDCLAHWREWSGQNPPDFSTQHALFAWTVAAHNAVNRRLGKPQWAEADALNRWKSEVSTDPPAGHGSTPGEGPEPSEPPPPALGPTPVNCAHAAPGPRPAKVHCKIGKFGGTPHVQLCRLCTSRVPLDPAAPALAAAPTPRASPSPASSQPDDSRLLLRCRLSPGDVLMMTAAVRDLHRTYPGRFVTAVQTPCPELWENSPYVVPAENGSAPWRDIDMEYPLINQSNQRPVHFLQGYNEFLGEQLRLPIPVTEFRGDIHLTEEEKGWMNQAHEHFGYAGAFWILMAGGKYDMTAKWWPPSFYQQVVDHFIGRVQFVQCGQADHWHPPLRGVFNLVGQTSTRQFVRLMYHARGVVCPVTFAMHLAAAVPTRNGRLRPCVVIAGGREPPNWEAYPGHQFLHTIGALPCCATGGCWRSRCQTVGDGDPKDTDGLCERPVYVGAELRVPQCMTLVRPADVIGAIERSLGTGE